MDTPFEEYLLPKFSRLFLQSFLGVYMLVWRFCTCTVHVACTLCIMRKDVKNVLEIGCLEKNLHLALTPIYTHTYTPTHTKHAHTTPTLTHTHIPPPPPHTHTGYPL